MFNLALAVVTANWFWVWFCWLNFKVEIINKCEFLACRAFWSWNLRVPHPIVYYKEKKRNGKKNKKTKIQQQSKEIATDL